jgi:hypothetical protein
MHLCTRPRQETGVFFDGSVFSPTSLLTRYSYPTETNVPGNASGTVLTKTPLYFFYRMKNPVIVWQKMLKTNCRYKGLPKSYLLAGKRGKAGRL